MDLRNFLKNQIDKGNINWESRSELLRASKTKISGHSKRILKEYENKFNFGLSIQTKNNAIKKYFDKQPKNSLINVEGAVNTINLDLSEETQISETIIYSRLKDKNFNNKNLKAQTLDNQVSKFNIYDVKITKEFEKKIYALKDEGIYVGIETTQRGSKTIRLRTDESYGIKRKKLDRSFPPHEDSIREIKRIIDELKN
tara:strand:+ start:602 stop:1198 length:597 start_codon:yes stop_codon:yes gene_type:complete